MPGAHRIWSDQETKTLLTTLVDMGGKELMAEKGLRSAAFTLAHAKVNRDHGRDFSYTQVADKYRALKRGYEHSCENSEAQDVSPNSGRVSAKKAKGVSDKSMLPSMKELSLLFGEPNFVPDSTAFPSHRRRSSGAAVSKKGILKIKEEPRYNTSGTPSKAEVIDLTIDDVVERPERKILCTPARKRDPSTEDTPQGPGAGAGVGGAHKASDSFSAGDLEVSTPNAISRTERVVSILMEEYPHVLDDEEMGDCLAILEDDKKASIFLSITKKRFRDNWLKKQITLFRGD